ncbi:alpha-ketoacid dehydrogenase subunit beta [Halovivax cerinus]|uniref:Alpha-ketoacid dehydrogenase subunit beta n=1 Tax=Halovivax cerinus TaxID=1487865 RepID=A0ABD5NQ08_9EURY|nr:alpha-ketoacid dehydrogenase subunit beta [Halovivax cerinus]
MNATLVEAVNDALHVAMEADDRTVVFGEDVAESGGVFRATEGLKDEFGGERVLDTPITEIGIVGSAVGLAMAGFRPVAEIQFSGFLPPTFNQLVAMASRIRWRTRGEHSAPMVVRAPYGGGVRALEHHSESLEAVYGHIPGLKVAIPSTPADAKGMLLSAIADPDPVLFLEPKRIYRTHREEVPEGDATVPLGEAAIRQSGEDLTVIAWGSTMNDTVEAVEAVEERRDASIEVVDLRTISPFDRETVIESVKKTGRAAIVQEAAKTGGFASELIATINDRALMSLEAPVQRITGFDVPIPMLAMEDYYLPNPPRIEEGLERALDAEGGV